MSKSSLRVLAVLLSAAIIAILFAGLDGLPRDVKAQIAAEKKIVRRGAVRGPIGASRSLARSRQ